MIFLNSVKHEYLYQKIFVILLIMNCFNILTLDQFCRLVHQGPSFPGVQDPWVQPWDVHQVQRGFQVACRTVVVHQKDVQVKESVDYHRHLVAQTVVLMSRACRRTDPDRQMVNQKDSVLEIYYTIVKN